MSQINVIASTLLILLALPSLADEIKLLNWEAYLADEVIEAFHRETGHTVRQFFISSDTERNSIMARGGGDQFDLVILDNSDLSMYSNEGLLTLLSPLIAPHTLSNNRWQQACGDYGVAYSWGTIGIAYRTSISNASITSWDQFFSPPPEHHGGIVVIPDIQDLVSAALLSESLSPNSSDSAELERAFIRLQRQQPHVLAYDYGVSYAIANRSASTMTMTLAYSADVEEIIETTGQQDWVYLVPEEGTMIWTDCWAAPASRELSKATLAFLEFISRPDIAALNAEKAWISTPVAAALPLTSDEHRRNQELYPPENILINSHHYQLQTEEMMALRARMVATVKFR
ncbi:putative spermidine/putrescine transport system substrate-binding protein [Ferrimonas sediminum]|uniref:Putative spermidine/putrescine transport system substrate-binding protein n=1 Tax=Ferrimonas sediminum TaxID=718193 RepID=A0A1G8UC20_9GAMM|nr:spermidine/putrescine ABC transporter substrate-binding protein [Ferrimonas sediminum]SDJ51319.1 putative spermidine/putrescine transport system substrate-binding protein [Ferrimonas sediminum]